MAAVASAGWISDGATLWVAAAVAVATAGVTGVRRWRSDEADAAVATEEVLTWR